MEGDQPRTKFAGVIRKKPSEVSGRTFRTRFSNSKGGDGSRFMQNRFRFSPFHAFLIHNRYACAREELRHLIAAIWA